MSPDHTFVTQGLVIRVILGGRHLHELSGQSQTVLCVVIVRHGDEVSTGMPVDKRDVVQHWCTSVTQHWYAPIQTPTVAQTQLFSSDTQYA